jgi:PAS domain S-box-containing protein
MGGPLRVLIVEDSEDDAQLILRDLRVGGYEPSFTRVETGPEMAAALDREAWDVVLSDHNLPEFDSLSALELLQGRGLDLPFIIVSGSIGEEVVAKAMKAGAHDFILKQNRSLLCSAVSRAMASTAALRERQRMELALRESEERYSLAVLGSRDGLWDWNIITGKVYYSSRFKEMLGFEAFGDMIETFVELIHGEDRALVDATLADHLERHAPFDVEFRLRTGTGEHRWFCSRGQALWDAAGRAIRMAGCLSDITARKQSEATLKQKLEIIEQQQEAIQELSTPVIEVWDSVLMMPLFGSIDVERAARMKEALMTAVVRTRSRYAIVDLTGVGVIDAPTADHIVKLVRGVQLLGAQGIVVGIQPGVAQTVVSIGVDLSEIVTLSNLREALQACVGTAFPGKQ